MTDPGLNAVARPGDGGVYRRLLGYVRPYWGIALVAVIGMVVSGGMESVFAWLMKPMLDRGFVERDPEMIRLIPFALMGIFLLRGVASFGASFGMMWVSRRVIHELRSQVFERLLTLPKRYFDNSSSARLLSRLTYNVEQVAQAGTDALIVLVRDSATAVALLGYMFFVSWRLALIFLGLGPILAVLVVYISKRFRRLSRRIQGSVGSVAYVAEEAIEGHEVIKVFGAQAHERRRFGSVNDLNMRQYIKFSATKALSTPVVQFVSAAALSFVIYLATRQEMIAEVTVGGFVSFITAMLLLMQPLKRLTNVNSTIQRGIAAGESIFEVIDETPETDNGTLTLDRAEGRVSFEDVGFAYDPAGPAVLTDIHMDVPAGETVAVVGRSGSGKTTLVNLLPRFYEPVSGTIRLDGIPLTDYRLHDLRRQIALVGQQVVLFNDTIAANIAFGAAGEADRADVERAAALANAREFIEALPRGFDTVVGENGVMLSGGQRQRIAIARALLKDAPILVLDEATSALDTESEYHIQRALETLMRGRTTFVIAHRLSTIEAADRILVLDGGRIIESGDHDTLIERGGAYAALHRMQFRNQQPERQGAGE
ncbi:Lipid A export ATP-binding/permease protein MsbA [wastewater metagenome]|uniref:Lipid A export ATP-binding/permease protein MsbA n=2 Tax=unclassified sequences TaxID=12908 RepID=A0A5B8RDS8_9ZZZZ|nr:MULTISPECIES: lipid A export permease/ATP-binding protein MsbA [Arhodomonas]MCS4503311.1 lipid A export permease/ATP-binding protein MsbA [Arhodomonas aquaeolei]QEA05602.1 lipid A export ATP-binding/permease protein MsbA [uncultured organism]